MTSCNEPLVPIDDGDHRWMSQHHCHIAQTKEREPDVLFIGDSLIHHLQYRSVWTELYEPLHCLNFGISGDKIQNVLWRILNGELNNINPKIYKKYERVPTIKIIGISCLIVYIARWGGVSGYLLHIHLKRQNHFNFCRMIFKACCELLYTNYQILRVEELNCTVQWKLS